MRNHSEHKRGFVRSSKAYYTKLSPEKRISLTVGMYHPDGGTSGEFQFEWYDLGGNLCARLLVFEDAWSALSQFKDLLDKLKDLDGMLIQEPELCNIMQGLGIEDMTEYVRPVS